MKAPERPVWNYQSDAAVPGVLLGNPVGVGSAEASATSEVSFEAPSIDVSDVMDNQANEGEEQS